MNPSISDQLAKLYKGNSQMYSSSQGTLEEENKTTAERYLKLEKRDSSEENSETSFDMDLMGDDFFKKVGSEDDEREEENFSQMKNDYNDELENEGLMIYEGEDFPKESSPLNRVPPFHSIPKDFLQHSSVDEEIKSGAEMGSKNTSPLKAHSIWKKGFKWDEEVKRANEMIFGNSSFRENQREIINATKSKRDVLALIPTGKNCHLLKTRRRKKSDISIICSYR